MKVVLNKNHGIHAFKCHQTESNIPICLVQDHVCTQVGFRGVCGVFWLPDQLDRFRIETLILI